MAHQTRTASPTPVPPTLDTEDRRRRNDAVMELLDEWMADDSGYDEETWPLLKEALNQERELVGARKLFRE